MTPESCDLQAAVYEVCRKTCDDGLDGTDIFPSHPELVGDRYVVVDASIHQCLTGNNDCYSAAVV